MRMRLHVGLLLLLVEIHLFQLLLVGKHSARGGRRRDTRQKSETELFFPIVPTELHERVMVKSEQARGGYAMLVVVGFRANRLQVRRLEAA